jgi:hypothetical protein
VLKAALVALAAVLATGCQPPHPSAPSELPQAVYKITAPDFSQGTAFAVDEHRFITAGHVCEHEGDPSQSEFLLTSTMGRRVVATRVAWADYDFPTELIDVCVLHTAEKQTITMPLADVMPAPGTEMGYIGFPKGRFVHERGIYLGDIDGDARWNDYAFTAPCAGGASGSPVYTKDGVFGVLVRVRVYDYQGELLIMPGTDGCVASPLSQIRLILAER